MDVSGEAPKGVTLADMVTKIGNPADPWPMIARIWELFTGKGIRTMCLSIGASAYAAPELELVESLGCPLHIVALTEAEAVKWEETAQILKERKRDPATASSFTEGAENRWILPKNVRISRGHIPYWTKGTLDVSGARGFPLAPMTLPAYEVIESMCSKMNMKDGAVRCDILKIDTAATAPGLERSILGAIMSAGFRPAVILVNWQHMPDENVETTIAAAQLQMFGYHLFGKEGTHFLYYYTDADMYQTCSWEDTSSQNPLVTEILRSVAAAKAPRTSPAKTGEV